jgi:glutaconate CoA-transferase, subunit A
MSPRPDRLASLQDVVADIPAGSHLALAGFAITRNAVAFVHELIRSGTRGLTVTQVFGGIETDLLVAAGAVDRLTYASGSLDRFGLLHAVNRGVQAGRLELFEYSGLALTLRLHAGGLGLPFVTTRSMLGSDLVKPLAVAGQVKQIESPFDGAPCLALSPMCPDVAAIHVDVADRAGNAVVDGPLWSLPETARASRMVALVAEEIVDVGELDPSRVTIPGSLVHSVAHVPRGGHPTAVYGRYDYDAAHLRLYAAAGSAGDDALAAYLDRFVHGVSTFDEYLALVAA